MISYCKNGKSAQVLACPQEKLNEILDSPEVAVACQKLTTVDHDSDEAKTLKQGLPLLMFFANYTDGIAVADVLCQLHRRAPTRQECCAHEYGLSGP